MSLMRFAEASRPYLVNAGGVVGLAVGLAAFQSYKIREEDENASLKRLALSVAAAVGVFFVGKAVNYSALPIAVGLVGQAILLYAENESYINLGDEMLPLFFGLGVISSVAVTALQRSGFLPRMSLQG